MKKLTTIITGIILTGGLLSGCGQNQNANTSATSSPVENGTQPAETQQSQNAVDTSNFIGEEKAKEIALQKAGITADGVTFDRVELEKDNGVWEYEIEFKKDHTEYDTEIKAEDGTIISWEVDND